MKRYPITELGDPNLRAKTKPVTRAEIQSPGFKRLIADMFFTMHAENGIGLAAPQIGISKRLAVIELYENQNRKHITLFPKTVLINPRILRRSKKTVQSLEGCLSFMGIRGVARRSAAIEVAYTDEHGKNIRRTVTGFPAIVFQHEIDHLDGLVYLDRVADVKTIMTEKEYFKRFEA